MKIDYGNLPVGTAIRAKNPQIDSGDFGNREAPAGAVGFIEDDIDRERGGCYVVQFQPSGIIGNWTPEEIATEAEILPEGHPDIPGPQVIAFARAVRDMFYDFPKDYDGNLVQDVSAEVIANLTATATTPEALALVNEIFPHDGVAQSVLFADADRIAAAAGAGDHFIPNQADMIDELFYKSRVDLDRGVIHGIPADAVENLKLVAIGDLRRELDGLGPVLQEIPIDVFNRMAVMAGSSHHVEVAGKEPDPAGPGRTP